jgi:hypothetical protein
MGGSRTRPEGSTERSADWTAQPGATPRAQRANPSLSATSSSPRLSKSRELKPPPKGCPGRDENPTRGFDGAQRRWDGAAGGSAPSAASQSLPLRHFELAAILACPHSSPLLGSMGGSRTRAEGSTERSADGTAQPGATPRAPGMRRPRHGGRFWRWRTPDRRALARVMSRNTLHFRVACGWLGLVLWVRGTS